MKGKTPFMMLSAILTQFDFRITTFSVDMSHHFDITWTRGDRHKMKLTLTGFQDGLLKMELETVVQSREMLCIHWKTCKKLKFLHVFWWV